MKHVFAFIVLAGVSLGFVAGQNPGPAPKVGIDDLRAASVRVDSEGSHGSGVLFKNGDKTFVWTDAHVVSDTQVVRTVIDPKTGLPAVFVTYKDVWVGVEEHEDGRKVGEHRVLSKVVRYDEVQDIALLLVYKKGYGAGTAKFLNGVPKVGAPVWHVGSFKGPLGTNSVSDGTVAAVGRLRREFEASDTNEPLIYDQASMTAHKGSSGGGIFLKSTGECLGLVTEFVHGDSGGLTFGAFAFTPARRLREWAKNCKAEYGLDDKVKVPPLAEIMAGPVTLTPIPVPPGFNAPARPAPVPVEPPDPFVIPFPHPPKK